MAGILNEKVDWVIDALTPELQIQDLISNEAWTCLHLVRPQ
jgi:ribosomal protein L11 methylase PrmA